MAGILGVRACGHAARIRVRQHGGGGSHGAGAVPCPTARHGRRLRKGKRKQGRGADVRAPLGSETRRWVGDRRASVG
jgi:hypothetical protein